MIHNKHCEINHEKIISLSQLFKKEETIDLISKAEKKDVQFKVVKNIQKYIQDIKESSFLILSIALVSYMLTVKGEEHWRLLEKHVQKNTGSDTLTIIESFVRESSSLRLYRKSKMRRIQKVITKLYPVFLKNFQKYLNNLEKLRKDIAKILGTSRDSKTVVFSIKMFYYCMKAKGLKLDIPISISIPVDYRISFVSILNNLIIPRTNIVEKDKKARFVRQYCKHEVREAWEKIGYNSNIPPIKIDTLLWVVGKCIEVKNKERRKCIKDIFDGEITQKQLKILEEILGISP